MTDRPNDPAWSPAPPDGATEPERLAALLDGRLGEAERDALLARLADDDEDLALFAEAAAIQRELEEEDAVAIPRMQPAEAADEAGDGSADVPRIQPAEGEDAAVPGVLPFRAPARPARRVDRRWLAAAAVLAGVTLLPLTWRASQGGAVREPSHAVAMLENPSAGLPVGWTDSVVWSKPRSRGEVVSEDGRPARVGAYMVDLELAIRAGDVENTRGFAARIAALLTDVSGGELFAQHFNRIVARPDAPAAELLPILEEANRNAAAAVDSDRYALGAWAEAARLAAARRDAAFFQERGTRRMLDRAETLVEDNAQARTEIAEIRAASESGARDWTALKTATDDLLKAIAS